jgi:hypothetical protein
VSCQRCETTYYCEGEGVQKLCGRCEDANATCNKNPIEHSFGAQSECSPCPTGWVNMQMFKQNDKKGKIKTLSIVKLIKEKKR